MAGEARSSAVFHGPDRHGQICAGSQENDRQKTRSVSSASAAKSAPVSEIQVGDQATRQGGFARLSERLPRKKTLQIEFRGTMPANVPNSKFGIFIDEE